MTTPTTTFGAAAHALTPTARPAIRGPHAERITEVRAARGHRGFARHGIPTWPPATLLEPLAERIEGCEGHVAAFREVAGVTDDVSELDYRYREAAEMDARAEREAIAAGTTLPPPEEHVRRLHHELLDLAGTREALDEAAGQAWYSLSSAAKTSVEAREHLAAQQALLEEDAAVLRRQQAAIDARLAAIAEAGRWLDDPSRGYGHHYRNLPDLEPARRAVEAARGV